jgi:hypothetical protein
MEDPGKYTAYLATERGETNGPHLRTPRVVSCIETQCSVLEVSSTYPHKPYGLVGGQLCVGWLAPEIEPTNQLSLSHCVYSRCLKILQEITPLHTHTHLLHWARVWTALGMCFVNAFLTKLGLCTDALHVLTFHCTTISLRAATGPTSLQSQATHKCPHTT